jgi:hypothetical protein
MGSVRLFLVLRFGESAGEFVGLRRRTRHLTAAAANFRAFSVDPSGLSVYGFNIETIPEFALPWSSPI